MVHLSHGEGSEAAANASDARWIYRRGGSVYGPISERELTEKIRRRRLSLNAEAALEGRELQPITALRPLNAAVWSAIRAEARGWRLRRWAWVVLLWICVSAVAGTLTLRLMTALEGRRVLQARAFAVWSEADAEKRVKLAAYDALKPMPLVALPTRAQRRSRARAARKSRQCQRTQTDVVASVSGFSQGIAACLSAARGLSTQAIPNPLPLRFRVLPEGGMTHFRLDAPGFHRGPLRNCMLRLLQDVDFGPAGGGPCPIRLPIGT